MPFEVHRKLLYLAVVPAAIAVLHAVEVLGFPIPNQPGALLLAVVFCAYRGGLAIGLVGAAMHMVNSAVFFSSDGHLFTYSEKNLERLLIIVVVAPAMAAMVGLLRREADRRLAAP